MHEASIALSVIGIAEKNCRDAGYSRIKNIELRIGNGSGVLPDALLMAFDIVKLETLAEGALLTIESVPLGGLCCSCKTRFTTSDQFILACPNCSSRDFNLDKGRELDIIEIEVD
ncbi:hydrogenase maturation nickel metallochaperone HypA [Nitrospirota bacterium]